ncbi:hypothetical protein JCM8208_003560, partial [Rhodotorula glutinis]
MSAVASPTDDNPPHRDDEAMEVDHDQADQEGPQAADDDDDDDDEGIDLRPGAGSPGDSSEEEATDSEEEREIRKGFIVDEDESARRRRRKHKKRRKHRDAQDQDQDADDTKSRKRRKGSDDEDAALDEDDLELLQENMGIRLTKPKGNKLRRLRRAGPASGSDDDSPAGRRSGRGRDDGGDLQDIFADDDDRAADDGGLEGLFGADEMAGFIEDDTDDSRSEAGDSDEDDEARRQRKRDAKRREKGERKKRRGAGLGMGRVEGITQEAWQEVAEVFGNGQDYAWAMEDDDDDEKDGKKELKD